MPETCQWTKKLKHLTYLLYISIKNVKKNRQSPPVFFQWTAEEIGGYIDKGPVKSSVSLFIPKNTASRHNYLCIKNCQESNKKASSGLITGFLNDSESWIGSCFLSLSFVVLSCYHYGTQGIWKNTIYKMT